MIRFFKIIFILLFSSSFAYAQDDEIKDILNKIQKDIKTLEKAVYSESFNKGSEIDTNVTLDASAEDVLTRHLLKLAEIERQFRELTNRFEEINFKIDKLSSRVSKVQADNQLRFQQLESGKLFSEKELKSKKKLQKKQKSLKLYQDHLNHKI